MWTFELRIWETIPGERHISTLIQRGPLAASRRRWVSVKPSKMYLPFCFRFLFEDRLQSGAISRITKCDYGGLSPPTGALSLYWQNFRMSFSCIRSQRKKTIYHLLLFLWCCTNIFVELANGALSYMWKNNNNNCDALDEKQIMIPSLNWSMNHFTDEKMRSYRNQKKTR
jgi:hypothetical protein